MNKRVAQDVDVYVSVGSNIRPAANLCLARDELAAAYGDLKISHVYRSDAVGFKGDDFLNVVIGFNTQENPQTLLEHIEELHQTADRVRSADPFSSRTLDVDLLLYGRLVSRRLKLPHPDIERYAFVMGPLAELAPGLTHPLTGKTMADMWREFDAASCPLQRVDIGLN